MSEPSTELTLDKKVYEPPTIKGQKTIETGLDQRKDLIKISEQMGTNEGGIYKDRNTEELFYIKFYQDLTQGKLEVLANNIYRKLGLSAPDSEIVNISNRLAIASKYIKGHKQVPFSVLKTSNEVLSGFVADAFLANWDVIGLEYDNIEKGADGKVYRIDNGGCFTFRAQGGTKSYNPDLIQEIDTLRNSSINPEASSLFSAIDSDDIVRQSQHLTSTLTNEVIDQLVNEAQLPNNLAQEIRKAMKGRINYLIKRFDKDTKNGQEHQIKDIIQRLLEQKKEERRLEIFPSLGIVADKKDIEDQSIDFILEKDHIVVTFKMTKEAIQRTLGDIVINNTPSNPTQYVLQSIDDTYLELCDAYHREVNDTTDLYISQGTTTIEKPVDDPIKLIQNIEDTITDSGYQTVQLPVRALEGAIRIEIWDDDVDRILNSLRETFKLLKMPEALLPPDQEDEVKYKEARFRWQHRLEKENDYKTYAEQFLTQQGVDLLNHLQREQVFSGYNTIVDRGALERYQKEGNIFLFHTLENPNTIALIIKYGLLSAYEKHKRGQHTLGLLTYQDFITGGADSVFLRATPESLKEDTLYFNKVTLRINPQVLERTDWYAYQRDTYGSTESKHFNTRPSPKAFFTKLREHFTSANEIMLRRGIPTDMIVEIIVSSQEQKDLIMSKLHALGINYVNGQLLNDYVKVYSDFTEFLATQGTTITSENPEQEINKVKKMLRQVRLGE